MSYQELGDWRTLWSYNRVLGVVVKGLFDGVAAVLGHGTDFTI